MQGKLLHTYLVSKELKNLIIQRSDELQIPLRYICHDVGVPYPDLMKQYINSTYANLNITEVQFERILEILGISVRFQFVVKRDYIASEMQRILKEEYELSNVK